MQKYNRVLLKISGEYLSGDSNNLYSQKILNNLVAELKQVHELGIQLAIVVGGGNILRGASVSAMVGDRVYADQMGLLSTCMNGLMLTSLLTKAGVSTKLYSSKNIDGVIDAYNAHDAVNHLQKNTVCIFVGGTGNPCFTTDTAACLRAIEINADIVLKATNVNGVYSSDPKKNSDARLFAVVSYDEILTRELLVMDLTAILLCKEHNMPLQVFKIGENNSLLQIIKGVKVGTTVVKDVK